MDLLRSKHQGPETSVVLIDEAYVRPDSMVAGMKAAAHEAAGRVAEGMTWEGDESILIPPAARAHALRMAQIWRQVADQLQDGIGRISGGEPPPDASAPVRSAPARSRACSPLR